MKGEKDDGTTELTVHTWGEELGRRGVRHDSPTLQVKGPGAPSPEVAFVSRHKQKQRLQRARGSPSVRPTSWAGSTSSLYLQRLLTKARSRRRRL